MTADIVIKGGLVVDGTGGASRRADVALTGGFVSEIGSDLSGGRIIDAAGAWVTPGFIDPHTHLDAQLFWDPSGRPSLQHGVTTAFIGSCGFGIAPCGVGAEDYLLRCLEAVEEIPFADMAEGVPFGWRSYGDYMDAVAALPLGINIATLVPHSPLRHSVLGAASAERFATGDELAELTGALEDALGAGAFGFTTSRGPNHVDGDGRQVPSRAADDAELEALVACCEGRVWQINVKAKGDPTGVLTAEEVATYASWSQKHDVTLTWTPLVVSAGTDGRGAFLLAEQAADLTANGARVFPQVCPMPLVTDVSLTEPSIVRSLPTWDVFAAAVADSNEPVALLRDSDWRHRLREVPEDHSSLLGPVYSRWTIASSTNHPDLIGRNLEEIGQQRNQHPVDVLLDVFVDDDLSSVIQVAVVNLDPKLVQQLVLHPSTLVGLGDSGAHVRSITNFSYPTTMLHNMVIRDEVMAVEKAIHQMTARPAAILGLSGRGVLEEGAAADICVVDHESLDPGTSYLCNDLPAGGGRMLQTPKGMRAVVVNGLIAIDADQPTDDPGGQLLRRT